MACYFLPLWSLAHFFKHKDDMDDVPLLNGHLHAYLQVGSPLNLCAWMRVSVFKERFCLQVSGGRNSVGSFRMLGFTNHFH